MESPINPTLRLVDIERIANIAHSHPSRTLLLVDNTFLPQFYSESSCLLLEADIALHSFDHEIHNRTFGGLSARALVIMMQMAVKRLG